MVDLSGLTSDELQALIAQALAERKQKVEAPAEAAAAPPAQQLAVREGFVANGEMRGRLDDPAPTAPPEERDSPEQRGRLLAILFDNPSGVPAYTLLDQYRIPPETIELARKHGQATQGDRGIALTHAYGGAWSPDRENVVDAAAQARYQREFIARQARLLPQPENAT